MDDALSKLVLDSLRANEAAAQHILDGLTNRDASTRPWRTPAVPDTELPHQIANHISGAQPWIGADYGGLAQTAQTLLQLMYQRPDVTLENIQRFWTEQLRVLAGASDLAAAKDDHRFDDPAWHDNPYYKMAMQSYLALKQGLDAWVDGLKVEHKEAERIRFMIQLMTEALAPSNWATNPAALRRYVETGGESAIAGFQHMVEDALHNGGMPSTVKRDALKVGRDMATTPGKVVHRTELFELLQYAPLTKDVHARPFLMVAPQINKFYFYDLSEKKSLIRYAVENGLQTFTISWRNPDLQHRDWNFDTYIGGIEEALDVVREITGSPDVNIEGGCVAGIEVTALMADLARRRQRKIHSATLMVTMLDTSVETQLGVLATPEAIEMARNTSHVKGLMEGSEMGRVFSFLRPNDLIWNYWVNNYLLGKEPPTFDVLAWNADTTRMTSGFHVQLLDLVQSNSLVRGDFKVNGRRVRLDAIRCDQFWLAGLADHITPWRACYASSRLLGGKREFVVADGGHIQSMISSPSNPKARYFVNEKPPATADDWLEGAAERQQSWWPRWRDWIKARSGKLEKAPRALGSRAHPPLIDAPGTYVFE